MQTDLLRSLKLQFTRRHVHVAARIESAVQDGNLDQVQSLSHALRGDAENLGMKRLAQLCQQLESESRRGRLPEQAVRSAWHNELARILTELEAEQEDSSSAEAHDRQLDHPRLQELLRRLLENLDGDILTALACLKEIGQVVQGTPAVPRFRPLQVGLEDFEIDRVRQQSEEWLKELSCPAQMTNHDCSS